MKFTKYITATALLLLSASPSLAHEMRHIGGDKGGGEGANAFMFHMGFSAEPAYEDEVNGLSISLSFHPDAAHSDELTEAVDTDKGGVVVIKEVEALFLESDTRPARVLNRAFLPVPRDEKGNIKKKFGTDNQYDVPFRPTIDGAYGFRFANILGFVSLLFYTVTLIPSILKIVFPVTKRNKILRWLFKNRRYLGVAAFIFGLSHGVLLTLEKNYIY